MENKSRREMLKCAAAALAMVFITPKEKEDVKRRVQIENVIDPKEVEKYLSENPKVILNVLAKNRSQIRRILD